MQYNRALEYQRLLTDPFYFDVQFNSKTGGLKATHIDHRFDRHLGHYETEVQELLYQNGHKFILQSEAVPEGIKTPDGLLNDKICELKSVLGTGKNNIKYKLTEALSQGCEHLVLFFPNPLIYSVTALKPGHEKYLGVLRKEQQQDNLKDIWIVVDNNIHIFK